MIFPHAYTLHEILLLRSAVEATSRPRRAVRWHLRVRAILRERPHLQVAAAAQDAHSQLAHEVGH